jgi:hypothetical protein
VLVKNEVNDPDHMTRILDYRSRNRGQITQIRDFRFRYVKEEGDLEKRREGGKQGRREIR